MPIDDRRIVRKGRLGPGEMLVVDTESGEVLENSAIKRDLAAACPMPSGLTSTRGRSKRRQPSRRCRSTAVCCRSRRSMATPSEDVQVILKPMARDGHEPVGSMGDDTPVGPLSQVGRPLYSYLRQSFAQVTNPPIDPLREQLVMSVRMRLGRRGNILEEIPEHAHLLEIHGPILLATRAQGAAPPTRVPEPDDPRGLEPGRRRGCASQLHSPSCSRRPLQLYATARRC